MLHPARLFFVGALAFLIGIFIATFISLHFLVFSGATVLALLIFIASRNIGVIAIIIVLAFSVGFLYMRNSLESMLEPQNVLISGWVSEEPSIDGARQQVILSSDYILHNKAWRKITQKIIIYTDAIPRIEYGEQIVIEGSLELPKYGIRMTVNKPTIQKVEYERAFLEKTRVSSYRFIYSLRDWFIGGLKNALPEPHSAYVAGILVGARSELPDRIKEDFARTSMSHVVAVSGYNVTIVAQTIGWLALLMVSRRRAFWLVSLVLVIFMILTGAQASIIRATIMGISVLFAQYVGRLPTPIHTLVLTAGIMVALDPFILRYSIGFQLSFLATFGILVVNPIIERFAPRFKYFAFLRDTFLITISAQLCVVPLLMYYFKTFSVLSLPVNLIILPGIPVLMLIGFISGIFGAIIPIFGQFIGIIAYFISLAMLSIIHSFASIPWSSVDVSISWHIMLSIYVVLGVFLFVIKTHQVNNGIRKAS